MDYRKRSLVALDIGGTKTDAIFWSHGKIKEAIRIATPKNRETFFRVIFRLVDGIANTRKIDGIAISIAGAEDYKTGEILRSPNMKFLNGISLRHILQKRFHVPARSDNDTHCFLLAESKLGAARGKEHVVALTLGTGVGGAVMIDGKLLRGKHGIAGELGQVIAAGDAGRFLRVEDLISSHGFARLGESDPVGLQRQAEKGKPASKKIFEKIGTYLGVVLANYTNIFDPEIIVLGGGISNGASFFMKEAIHEMKKHAMLPAQDLPPVKVSKLKHAAALGAVFLFDSV